MDTPSVTTFDEMTEHLAELESAAHSLAHAMCDDGCDCDTTLVLAAHSGRPDYKATGERDMIFAQAAGTKYRWGIHNPHTRWGNDVAWPAQALKGTPHEVVEVHVEGDGHWPHPDLEAIAVSDAELNLARRIDNAERVIAAALRIHINPAAMPWGKAYDTPECKALRKLAEYGTDEDE